MPDRAVLSGKRTPSSKVGATAAGAGGGTLLVLLAQNMPETNPWKSWLVLAAPAATLFLVAIWLWLRKRIEIYARRATTNKLIEQAKQTLDHAIQNPLTSLDHRETLRKEYEQLELLQVKRNADRIKILTRETLD